MKRAAFAAPSGALLAACMLPGQLAWASDEVGASTIVVTARRLVERSADIPLRVSAISPEAIGSGAVDSLQALAARVPGLSFESTWGGGNAFPVLRGQNQPSISGDSVGMFVDGVYQANRDAIDVDPFDLDRIEVVQGPQSALFGHSSFAGLINYVPAQPTEELTVRGSADLGSDNVFGLQGAVSGPLSSLIKARLAIGWRQSDGTWENPAAPGQRLGNTRRLSVAGTLATRDSSGPLSLRLSGRYNRHRSSHPAQFTLDSRDYNCGGRDPQSGVWSYFCGEAPVRGPSPISPGIPDSYTWSAQAALHAAFDLGGVELRSDTSWYKAVAEVYRDFDGTAAGDIYGVCTVGVNCPAPGNIFFPVQRLQRVNIVQRHPMAAREFAEELRLMNKGARRIGWMLGAAAFWTRQGQRTNFSYGAERGALAAGERFTSPVLANPQRVGTLAAINAALAADPDRTQTVQNDATESRRTLALFGTADLRLDPAWKLRAEFRANWERIELDSRLANFVPSFGNSLGARNFFDFTPRFGIEFHPSQDWMAYAALARGSRSGGINAVPNLPPQEQTFEPETNWTTEAGLKYAGRGVIRSAVLAVYHVDWRNTQILGFSTTPGVTALIQRNTRGIETWGVEFSGEAWPRAWLGLEGGFSYAHPRFKRGSEDPGSNTFCGLTAVSTVSSFCTIRPSAINPGQLAPDISGKTVLRAAELTWTAAMTLAPQASSLHGLRLRTGLSWQGNVFDRAVNGLNFGERLLLDARLSMPLGRFAIELWGTNLTGRRYVRSGASRQPQFYTGIPRPTDLILGDGRRAGITLRFSQ